MKTPLDPRHKKRQLLIQELFKTDFHKQVISKEAESIFTHKAALDQKIQQAAPDFPVDKINKVDLAILRLGVYELLFTQNTPQNVIIDEAVELAKEYGNETSPAFVNGVLGHILTYAKPT